MLGEMNCTHDAFVKVPFTVYLSLKSDFVVTANSLVIIILSKYFLYSKVNVNM